MRCQYCSRVRVDPEGVRPQPVSTRGPSAGMTMPILALALGGTPMLFGATSQLASTLTAGLSLGIGSLTPGNSYTATNPPERAVKKSAISPLCQDRTVTDAPGLME